MSVDLVVATIAFILHDALPVYDARQVGEIGPVTTPTVCPVGALIVPCALIKPTTARLMSGYPAAQCEIEVYYYAPDDSYAVIETTATVARAALHERVITPGWQVQHRTDIYNQRDPLLHARMIVSRYIAYIRP